MSNRKVSSRVARNTGRVTPRKDTGDKVELPDDVFNVPFPVATRIAWTNLDGEPWIILEYTTPAGTSRVWMRASDALRHVRDIEEVYLTATAKGDRGKEVVVPSQMPSGLFIPPTGDVEKIARATENMSG